MTELCELPNLRRQALEAILAQQKHFEVLKCSYSDRGLGQSISLQVEHPQRMGASSPRQLGCGTARNPVAT
eukprot:scaffold2008_cov283-Pinguiococcus_pyrenoidosus.AAC.7